MTHVIRLRARKWRRPTGGDKPIPLIDPNCLGPDYRPPPIGPALRFNKALRISCIECGSETTCDCADGCATVDVQIRDVGA